ncbi:MAG: chorismate synthase [Clostridia bacterium]|nr:chorismate synthase [Clostridia bacterium]
MKNIFGNSLTITLFGESHGPSVGAVLDGLAPGIPVSEQYIADALSRRRPRDDTATARREPDDFVIESGVFNGYTTGTPLCIRINNTDTHSGDYSDIRGKARPGHCDYPAFCKYHGYEDYRGGGHFSGRITAAIVAAGAIVTPALEAKGIVISTHLSKCAGIDDIPFDFGNVEEMIDLNKKPFPALSDEAGERMKENILKAKAALDSVGGILETAIIGMPSGCGEPWFDSVESMLSHALFSIPAVKGVEFGAGFALADMTGSAANDGYGIDADGNINTPTNNNGGICGGITNGMPIVFRCAVKPTPSIAKKQRTVDFMSGENVELEIKGRHDPCIAPRAASVVNAIAALTVADILTGRSGTDCLTGTDVKI